MTIEVRPIRGDEWKTWRALRLAALSESPDAFGSTFEQWRDAADARWLRRLRDVPFNAIAYFAGEPCGIVSGTSPDGNAVELISLWVSPSARGKGAADALVRAVLAFARESNARAVTLSVRESNTFATALYRRHGFVECGDTTETGSPPERGMILRLNELSWPHETA